MNVDQAERLRKGVWRTYSWVAENPVAEHPFPVGRHFAESLGYPPDLLADIPVSSVEAFAGASNVAIFADISVGATVLDLGCGAGLDSLIAARRVGSSGRVICLDFSRPMLSRARQAATLAGSDNVTFYQAEAEHLFLKAGIIDVALVNGIFNLNPTRHLIFDELARVMRPGGIVYGVRAYPA